MFSNDPRRKYPGNSHWMVDGNVEIFVTPTGWREIRQRMVWVVHGWSTGELLVYVHRRFDPTASV